MTRKMFIAAIAAITMATAVAAPVVSYASKLTDAQQQQQDLQNQMNQTKNTITNLKNQENSLRQQLANVEKQISDLQSSIVGTQADIAKKTAEIDQLKKQIEDTQKQIDAQYQVLTNRVRLMYEAGQSSYLDVVFSSTSFSDLLDRLQLLSMIAQQDKQVLTDIRTSKATLDNQQQQMKTQLAQYQTSLAHLNTQKSQQESAQNQETSILSQVHDKRLSQQAELNSESSAMQNLQSLISQLEASEGGYTGPSSGWTWPVPGYRNVSSPYGWRTWSNGSKEFHNGIDIPAPIGTPIVAATSGRVLYAGPASGFGDWIVIESAGGLIEIYGHMYSYEIKVSAGQVVSTGQVIAGVGNNGFSTGPHCHFTVATGFDSNGYPITVSPDKYVG